MSVTVLHTNTNMLLLTVIMNSLPVAHVKKVSVTADPIPLKI